MQQPHKDGHGGRGPPLPSALAQSAASMESKRLSALMGAIGGGGFGYPPPPSIYQHHPQMTQAHYAHPQAHQPSPYHISDSKKRPSMMQDFLSPSATFDVSRRLMASRPSMLESSMLNKGPAYTPQVEAISPTPEDQPSDAGAAKPSSKTNIANKIENVEKEIRTLDQKIKHLERKKTDIEARAGSGGGAEEGETPANETGKMTLFQRIYSENRRKAAHSHAKLAALGGPASDTLPLYQEPMDSPQYRAVKAKFETVMRPALVAHLRKAQAQKSAQERYMSEEYNRLHAAWQKKVERAERNPKRMAKEAKNRELFERVFPELKKAREEKEKAARAEGRREGVARPEDTEEEDRKLAQQAVIPPPLLTPHERRYVFINTSGLVKDPAAEHQARLDAFHISWTDEEKRTFRERLLQHGKNFAAIALYLPQKSPADCVQFYYLSKKRECYKQAMRKGFSRRGRGGRPYRPPPMPRLINLEPAAKDDVEEPKPETEHCCILCKQAIDSTLNPGRVLTRSAYEHYGIQPQENPDDVRICQKCRLGFLKKRYLHCPVQTCATQKRKVKPTRPLPKKMDDLSVEQRDLVERKLGIPADVSKCCSGCHKRILRAVEHVAAGKEHLLEPGPPPPPPEEENSQSAWSETAGTAEVEEEPKGKEEEKPPPLATPKVAGLEESEEEEAEEEGTKEPKKEEPDEKPKLVGATMEEVIKAKLERQTGQDRSLSSGESNATLSADEGAQSEAEATATAVYKPKFIGSALPAATTASVSQPSVRDIIDSTISKNVGEGLVPEGLAARQQPKVLAAVKGQQPLFDFPTAGSPDIEIIGQKMPGVKVSRGSSPPPPLTTKPSVSYLGNPASSSVGGMSPGGMRGSITQGTARTNPGVSTPTSAKPSPSPKPPLSRPSDVTASFAHQQQQQQQQQQNTLAQAVHLEHIRQAAQQLAHQSYVQAKQSGLSEADALTVFHRRQTLIISEFQQKQQAALQHQHQVLAAAVSASNDYRTAAQMGSAISSTATSQHQAQLAKDAAAIFQYQQHQRLLAEQQREQQQRQEQERRTAAILAAEQAARLKEREKQQQQQQQQQQQAAAAQQHQQQQQALMQHLINISQQAEAEKYLLQHHQQLLLQAAYQQRGMQERQSMLSRGSPSSGAGPSGVKQEPRMSPATPTNPYAAHFLAQDHKAASSSVIQETKKAGDSRPTSRNAQPVRSKGAMKDFSHSHSSAALLQPKQMGGQAQIQHMSAQQQNQLLEQHIQQAAGALRNTAPQPQSRPPARLPPPPQPIPPPTPSRAPPPPSHTGLQLFKTGAETTEKQNVSHIIDSIINEQMGDGGAAKAAASHLPTVPTAIPTSLPVSASSVTQRMADIISESYRERASMVPEPRIQGRTVSESSASTTSAAPTPGVSESKAAVLCDYEPISPVSDCGAPDDAPPPNDSPALKATPTPANPTPPSMPFGAPLMTILDVPLPTVTAAAAQLPPRPKLPKPPTAPAPGPCSSAAEKEAEDAVRNLCYEPLSDDD